MVQFISPDFREDDWFVFFAPVFSERNIPALAKTAIIFLLSVLAMNYTHRVPVDLTQTIYIVELIINVVVGALIGFIAELVLAVVEIAGETVDSQAGLNSAVLMGAGEQQTLIRRTLRNVGILIFLYGGGMEMTLYSLKLSFEFFPLAAWDLSLLHLGIGDIIEFTRRVIVLGIVIASPVLAIIVFMDIVLGLMSRAAQQINPFQLSFSLKPIVGLVVLMFTLPLMQSEMIKVVEYGSNIFKVGDLQMQTPMIENTTEGSLIEPIP